MSNKVLLAKAPGLDEPIPEEYLIESDGEPMESPWHRRAMNGLIQSAAYYHRGRKDYYVGGNMFVYYSPEQARKKDFRGPDFFFVWNTNRLPERMFWYVWEERRTPDVVIELVSPTTKAVDHGVKKDIYEQILQVRDYYCFDPDSNVLDGWRLHGRGYATLTPNEKGWLWCEELQLWLGAWNGTLEGCEGIYPRFFDRAGNLVLTPEEAEREKAEAAAHERDQEREKAAAAARERDQEREKAGAAARERDQERDEAAAAARERDQQREKAEAAARERDQQREKAEAAARERDQQREKAEAIARDAELQRKKAEAAARDAELQREKAAAEIAMLRERLAAMEKAALSPEADDNGKK